MRIITTIALGLCCCFSSTSLAQNNNSLGAPPPFSFGPNQNAAPNTSSQVGTQTQPVGQNSFNSNLNGLSNQPSARIATNNSPTVGVDNTRPAIGGAGENPEAPAGSIQTSSIIGMIREGGVLMIPILFCSFVLVVFVFERLVYLRRGRVIPKPFVRGVIEQLEQQQLDQEEALALCEENGSPIAELFTAALKKWGRPAVEIEQAVVDAGAHITSGLKKYLRLFNAISNLSPLLGLLGTVQGMIAAFNSISHGGAMGRPELLADSIGLALITTAAGLCVAIPSYTAYVYFLGRTDKLILEMDSLVSNVIELTCAEAQSRSRSRSRKAA
ncbi:MAG: MotA/TolQ/ExbB proton channel family protein [Pirellulales bacterium]